MGRSPRKDIETTITNALRVAAERFTEHANEARAGAAVPQRPDEPTRDADGNVTAISIRPTPAGFARIAVAFEEQATEARELAESIEEHGLSRVLRQANVA